MSAIAGIWHFDGNPAAEAECARMLAPQEMYGPHDGRLWTEGGIALGRRLYRILPEDIHDRQPLTSRDGRLTLVADVRIDYRDELERELNIAPGEARQTCDAALLLICLERWGEQALDRLCGDFAFALWDRAAQKLLLVRDFRGRRPLHYHRGRGFFAFATMAKGLHALPDIPMAPDEQRVAEALALMPDHGDRSFFKGIGRLLPGTVMTVTPSGETQRRFWEPQRSNLCLSDDEYAEGLRHHLDEAVRTRLRGAGNTIGTYLSAGFDSGAVTATAARLMAPQGGKVIAFTSVPREGYDGPAPRNRFGDEGPLAAATAAMYPNIEHVLVRGNGRSPLEGLDRSFYYSERPTLNLANNVWGTAIRKAAQARKLSVVLSGQMGNMTISYNGYMLLPELVRAGRMLAWWRTASQLIAASDMRWRGALVQSFGWLIPAPLWMRLNHVFLGHTYDIQTYTALSADGIARHDLAAIAGERGLDFTYRPRADGFEARMWVMRRGDGGTGGKGALAASGLDIRDPTADRRLVEFCLNVPSEQYLKDGNARSLARRAFAGQLPQAVLDDRKRGYQAIDWHEGVTAAAASGEITAELERLEACDPATRMIDVARLKRLVENMPDGGWERDAVMQPYRLALLRGISAGHFLRKASGGNR